MHMRIRAARLAVLASLALAGGCALLATEPDPDDRRSVGRLVLDLRETHGLYEVGKGAPEIRLLIETERIYSHLGAQIHGEVRISGREITFRADHVTECSGICLAAIGPAQHRTLLPLEHGDYTLSVTADGRTDRYRVRVTAEAIEMQPLAATFTTARYPLAWRYPPRSMVHVCNASQGREALCASFLDRLRARVPLEPLTFQPTGRVPYPVSEALHGHDWRATYYRYANEADFAAAGATLRDFAAEHPSATLVLTNWLNESHLSWWPAN
jgi:hypothetical protein